MYNENENNCPTELKLGLSLVNIQCFPITSIFCAGKLFHYLAKIDNHLMMAKNADFGLQMNFVCVTFNIRRYLKRGGNRFFKTADSTNFWGLVLQIYKIILIYIEIG